MIFYIFILQKVKTPDDNCLYIWHNNNNSDKISSQNDNFIPNNIEIIYPIIFTNVVPSLEC